MLDVFQNIYPGGEMKYFLFILLIVSTNIFGKSGSLISCTNTNGEILEFGTRASGLSKLNPLNGFDPHNKNIIKLIVDEQGILSESYEKTRSFSEYQWMAFNEVCDGRVSSFVKSENSNGALCVEKSKTSILIEVDGNIFSFNKDNCRDLPKYIFML